MPTICHRLPAAWAPVAPHAASAMRRVDPHPPHRRAVPAALADVARDARDPDRAAAVERQHDQRVPLPRPRRGARVPRVDRVGEDLDPAVLAAGGPAPRASRAINARLESIYAAESPGY